jgi:hypothetical protein
MIRESRRGISSAAHVTMTMDCGVANSQERCQGDRQHGLTEALHTCDFCTLVYDPNLEAFSWMPQP